MVGEDDLLDGGWRIVDGGINGEITDNSTDWLGGIDVNLIHVRASEYPFTNVCLYRNRIQ